MPPSCFLFTFIPFFSSFLFPNQASGFPRLSAHFYSVALSFVIKPALCRSSKKTMPAAQLEENHIKPGQKGSGTIIRCSAFIFLIFPSRFPARWQNRQNNMTITFCNQHLLIRYSIKTFLLPFWLQINAKAHKYLWHSWTKQHWNRMNCQRDEFTKLIIRQRVDWHNALIWAKSFQML